MTNDENFKETIEEIKEKMTFLDAKFNNSFDKNKISFIKNTEIEETMKKKLKKCVKEIILSVI